jgi:hypothetical protein
MYWGYCWSSSGRSVKCRKSCWICATAASFHILAHSLSFCHSTLYSLSHRHSRQAPPLGTMSLCFMLWGLCHRVTCSFCSECCATCLCYWRPGAPSACGFTLAITDSLLEIDTCKSASTMATPYRLCTRYNIRRNDPVTWTSCCYVAFLSSYWISAS